MMIKVEGRDTKSVNCFLVMIHANKRRNYLNHLYLPAMKLKKMQRAMSLEIKLHAPQGWET